MGKEKAKEKPQRGSMQAAIPAFGADARGKRHDVRGRLSVRVHVWPTFRQPSGGQTANPEGDAGARLMGSAAKRAPSLSLCGSAWVRRLVQALSTCQPLYHRLVRAVSPAKTHAAFPFSTALFRYVFVMQHFKFDIILGFFSWHISFRLCTCDLGIRNYGVQSFIVYMPFPNRWRL